jgi:parallel beta-helix repeat protein
MINMFRKTLLTGIIVLIICTTVIPSNANKQVIEKTHTITYITKTLYVGGNGSGNYTSIQDAIDNASDGYTIFVFDESSPYYENVTIDKSIQLFGETKETTIIDAQKNGSVIFITSNNVAVTGFTLQNSGDDFYSGGIEIRADYNLITENIMIDNRIGVTIKDCKENTVSNNHIYNNTRGTHPNIYYAAIFIKDSNSNLIIGNIIENNDCSKGIHLWKSNRNEIIGNEIAQNKGSGISLGVDYSWYSSNNIISGNIIRDNTGRGVYITGGISGGSGNKITSNTLIRNSIYLHLAKNTLISNNNFFGCGSTFDYEFELRKDYNNEWTGNFWHRSRYFPKLIKGTVGYLQGWAGYFSLFRWYQIDWNPVKEPYDI